MLRNGLGKRIVIILCYIAALVSILAPAMGQQQKTDVVEEWMDRVETLAAEYSLQYEEERPVGRYAMVSLPGCSSLAILDTREGLILVQSIESTSNPEIIDASAEFATRMRDEVIDDAFGKRSTLQVSDSSLRVPSANVTDRYARRLARTW